MSEHIGFCKEAMGPGAWTAARKAFKASARTVPKAGPKIQKAKPPGSMKKKLLGAGALLGVGAVGGGVAVGAAQTQAPMPPGSLAREKRRTMTDRFGNY